MPNKEHSTLVLRRRELGHPEIPGPYNICIRLWFAVSKHIQNKSK